MLRPWVEVLERYSGMKTNGAAMTWEALILLAFHGFSCNHID
jgi:hypothetical protein